MSNQDLFFLIFNLNKQSPILDQVMIFGATTLIYLVFALCLILAFKGGAKEKKAVLLILIGLSVTILLVKIIHLFVYVNRPFVAFNFLPIVAEKMDASFPSRHATIAAVIAFSFAYFKSKWALLLLPIMLWVGIARVFVGVHYPQDILGGFAVAGIALFIGLRLKRKIFQTYFSP
ncbi:phosphatase PAP2 family protein [Candidatus Daviesbacteria bacterium]|nr:phosphatase PAP2 family protein [Candidatus Daviesbacteria bacterium]